MSPARCLSWAARDVCKWCTPSCGHLQLGKWCLFDPIWSYLHANPSHSNLRTGAMLTHAHPPNSVVGSCDEALVRLYTPSKSQCQGSQDKGCLAESLLQWVFRCLHLCEETTELDWCMMVQCMQIPAHTQTQTYTPASKYVHVFAYIVISIISYNYIYFGECLGLFFCGGQKLCLK
jgi:hypothetical protein